MNSLLFSIYLFLGKGQAFPSAGQGGKTTYAPETAGYLKKVEIKGLFYYTKDERKSNGKKSRGEMQTKQEKSLD